MLPSSESLNSISGNWSAVYCKPRQEKALAWDLCRLGVPYFLPMVLRETSSGGRRRRNLYPIFKSYVFVAGGEEDRLAVIKTNRLVQWVKIDPAEQATFRQEIFSLELALHAAPEKLEIYSQLVTGKRVGITSGPMKGAEGIVLNAENPARIWIGVTMMGAGASIEIHADMVELLAGESVAESRTGQIEYQLGEVHYVAKNRVAKDRVAKDRVAKDRAPSSNRSADGSIAQ